MLPGWAAEAQVIWSVPVPTEISGPGVSSAMGKAIFSQMRNEKYGRLSKKHASPEKGTGNRDQGTDTVPLRGNLVKEFEM